ncbi:hypothetical protein [Halomicrobium salinisoli]|uniref:hypothetical protein n=1 Tax=Halomicrobium salinisoli TaxID=2878391 RepID=UPI001CF0CDCB|nr:hypothetical protein [Halomicrobium salinisoli]
MNGPSDGSDRPLRTRARFLLVIVSLSAILAGCGGYTADPATEHDLYAQNDLNRSIAATVTVTNESGGRLLRDVIELDPGTIADKRFAGSPNEISVQVNNSQKKQFEYSPQGCSESSTEEINVIVDSNGIGMSILCGSDNF